MVPHSTPSPPMKIGVGIDTSRYGHYAAFLRDDLNAAAGELQFVESAAGYAQLCQRFEQIVAQHGPVHFLIRLDAAGQYADNLLHFLDNLAAAGTPPFTLTLSCGDPQRNKNYRAAVFGSQKSDPIEARAAARFALTEWPQPVTPLSHGLRILRQIAARLQAVVRQRTRLINQLHHLLALTFPELALLTKDLAAGWVLELVHRYPTAQRLAEASAHDLDGIAYLPAKLVEPLRASARASIASLHGPAIEELVRDQVRQLRDAGARQKRLETLLADSYRGLPDNHLDSIPGIGAVTAAVLTAFILDIDRFETPGKLVAYFGILPIEVGSGVERDGQARPAKRYVMCRRGNDLVRRYLWMAALSAVRFNPAVRALYARVVAKHPNHKAVAVGHAMRKLLHLVFAVWKTGQPFDAAHYPWPTPAHLDQGTGVRDQESESAAPRAGSDIAMSLNEPAAGLTLSAVAGTKEVTAAWTPSLSHPPPRPQTRAVDFLHVKKQLPMVRVLEHLGLASKLRGSGAQRRCACPIHRADGRGRTFSVNVAQNVFHCFEASCQKKGDVIDLWAALQGLSLRDAAADLVQTFNLEPTPPNREEAWLKER